MTYQKWSQFCGRFGRKMTDKMSFVKKNIAADDIFLASFD